MDATPKTGDVVQLKSGGPRMTVTGPYNDKDVTCVWFVEMTGPVTSSFPFAALALIESA